LGTSGDHGKGIQDSVKLVDDTVVGDNAMGSNPGNVAKYTGNFNRDRDGTTFESADDEVIVKCEQIKHTVKEVLEKDPSQSFISLSTALVRKSKVASGSSVKALLIGAAKVSSPGQRGHHQARQFLSATTRSLMLLLTQLGKKTLPIMWMTPFETSRSATSTLMPLTAVGGSVMRRSSPVKAVMSANR
jgi:hypothetical protein